MDHVYMALKVLKIQFMISASSLVHACVATVASLAGGMAVECWHMYYLATASEEFGL